MLADWLGLDFHTLAFTVVLSTLVLSALLFTARLYAEDIQGVGCWAMGNLAIGAGIFIIVYQIEGLSRHLIPGVALIAFGNGLYINGIQAFFGGRRQYAIPFALCLAVVLVDTLCAILWQDVRLAMLANIAIHCMTTAACGWLLLKHAGRAWRNPYGLTAGLFLGMALLMGVRFVSVLVSAPETYAALDAWSANRLVFLWAGLFELCLAFGFVLMLNYRMAEQLRAFAAHDWLSGALNRRYLQESAARLAANCQRLNLSLAVLLFDLDHFKRVNDKFGHQVGDEVIRRFAETVRKVTRSGDLFGRYGGEEFCLLLPNATAAQGRMLAERIRASFEREIFNCEDGTFACTVSAGVSDSSMAGFDPDQLITAADQALYESKNAGRNRVVVYARTSPGVRLERDSYAS